MIFFGSKLYSKIEKLVDLLENSIDEEQISELKATALKRRVEFLIDELSIITAQEESIQAELSELKNQLKELQEESGNNL